MIRPASPAPESAAVDAYQQAISLYKQGEYTESLKQLVSGLQVDVNYKPLYLLARDILGKMGGTEERRLFAIALSEFDQFQPFFDLGYHFIDTEHYPLAIVFLKKARELEPSNVDAAYELAFAYMARFQIEAALQVLDSIDYSGDFWAAYLYYQCKLWLKQPEGVAEFTTEAQTLLESQTSNESIELAQYKINELKDSLARYQHIEFQTQTPIREWHFIQYGAAILQLAEEDTAEPAGGRYVALWGSLAETRRILEQFVKYLTQLQRLPQRVIAIPERESEIIGRALAQLLQVPFSTLEVMEDFSESLIVAMDSRSFNGIEPLIDIQPNQTVFAFYQSWLERSMIVPDVVGLLAQHYWSPWADGRLKLDEQQVVHKLPADERPIEVLVQELLKTPLDTTVDTSTFQQQLSFYLNHQQWLKGGVKGGFKRSPFTVESPVPGSYFGY